MKTESELRELDAWVAFYVMGTTTELVKIQQPDISFFSHYTTDPAAAMEVLQKCMEEQHRLGAGDFGFMSKDGNNFWIRTVINGRHVEGDAPTLALCISKFAKQLFSK